MHLEVTFRNMKGRSEVNRRAQALFAKLERFLDTADEGHLTLSTEHGKAISELVVQSRGTTHKAIEEHDELRAALDTSFHRVEEQLRRSKDKRIKRGRGDRAEAAPGDDPVTDDEDDWEEV